MADDKETSFKVTDKRAFNADGSPRQDQSTSETSSSTTSQAEDSHKSATIVDFPSGAKRDADAPSRPADTDREHGRIAGLPPPSFGSFLNMLAVEAAMHLGLVENPIEGGRHVDLPAAQHMIDTLAMLEDKTTGNLTAGEKDLLETILSDLRMQFVVASRKK